MPTGGPDPRLLLAGLLLDPALDGSLDRIDREARRLLALLGDPADVWVG
jgi:hypothetical protein